ncbi:MAG: PilZ domain-containing protein [Deltaproteobacteria bacterium]|jgi:uncharacterized protein (TIGR02266 family)|nr:PilZ domain-containing protein [Deltaproteobacteria bacterium]MBT6432101.1 PilZ domain-containing protein [Deltaproteobacteria bacterium]MBT6491818.1 PilZ domain-containing protein [Deltaproteobacteria bacterium]
MTVQTDPTEQLRRYNRYPLSVEFKLSDSEDPVHGEILFDTVNVSAGGAFLRSDLLMDIGAKVDVTFSMPGQDESFTTKAVVAWVTRGKSGRREPGMGIEFTGLDDKAKALIDGLIQKTQETRLG